MKIKVHAVDFDTHRGVGGAAAAVLDADKQVKAAGTTAADGRCLLSDPSEAEQDFTGWYVRLEKPGYVTGAAPVRQCDSDEGSAWAVLMPTGAAVVVVPPPPPPG